MARFELYIDTYSGDFVVGPGSASMAPSPRLVLGDTPELRVYLLARTQAWPNGTQNDDGSIVQPYTVINNADFAMKAALGIKNGLTPGTIYSAQFVWSKDAANQYFYANFPVNTTELATLIGAREQAQAWLEFAITDGTGAETTVLQKSVQVQGEVIKLDQLTTAPGLTPISKEEAFALFLPREVHGAIILVNDNTGHKMALFLGDDDSFHAELIAT